jgi:hypothetical protein
VDALQFNRYEKAGGEFIANKIPVVSPNLRKVFKKNPALIGEYFIDDAILTAASRAMFDRAERRQLAREEAAKKAAEAKAEQIERKSESFTQRREQERARATQPATVGI